MPLIQIKDHQSWSALPCASVASAPSSAPEGSYHMLDYAAGDYSKPQLCAALARERPAATQTLTVDAAALRWVCEDAEAHDTRPDYALPWVVGGYLCSTKRGARMRAVAGKSNGHDLSVQLPAIVGKYFTAAQGPVLIGHGYALDPISGRALWFDAVEHPAAPHALAMLTGRYSKRQAWEAGCEKLDRRHVYFDTAITRGVPAGTACYNLRDPWVLVTHDAGRFTVVAPIERKE